mmetsp:Transcript_17732/g.57356  ORF Transcript_17732/g.57356 Transcript_17732/m.57356 type:complete len:277 (-) Transcript_17732:467-1297(-)
MLFAPPELRGGERGLEVPLSLLPLLVHRRELPHPGERVRLHGGGLALGHPCQPALALLELLPQGMGPLRSQEVHGARLHPVDPLPGIAQREHLGGLLERPRRLDEAPLQLASLQLVVEQPHRVVVVAHHVLHEPERGLGAHHDPEPVRVLVLRHLAPLLLRLQGRPVHTPVVHDLQHQIELLGGVLQRLLVLALHQAEPHQRIDGSHGDVEVIEGVPGGAARHALRSRDRAVDEGSRLHQVPHLNLDGCVLKKNLCAGHVDRRVPGHVADEGKAVF